MNPIAYCGLACCVCSENNKCVGCQSGGCDIHGWCKNHNCCREKGLNGCWECDDFPCSGSMLDTIHFSESMINKTIPICTPEYIDIPLHEKIEEIMLAPSVKNNVYDDLTTFLIENKLDIPIKKSIIKII